MFTNPKVASIWRVVRVVKTTMGLTMGLYIFTYGALYYDKFGGAADSKNALLLTAILYMIVQGATVLLEVPTGAIGDAIGRVNTVLWSMSFRLFFFIGLAFLTLFSNVAIAFTIGVVASILFAFSYTFFSGTFTAWVVDSLREADPDIGYEHILSRGYTYEFTTQIIGAIIAIGSYHYGVVHLSFLLGVLICLACIIFCRGEMKEVKNLQFIDYKGINAVDIGRRMAEIIVVGARVCRRTSAVLWLILIWASFLFLINVVDYLWPVYLREGFKISNQTAYWMVTAVIVLLMETAGSHSLTWLTSRWGRRNHQKTHNNTLRRWMAASTLFSAMAIIALGYVTWRNGSFSIMIFAIAVLGIEFSYGFVAPCYETLINNYIPEDHAQERATIMSLGSMVRSVFAIFLIIFAAGKSGATTTVGWIIPATLLLVITLVGSQLIKRYQKAKEIEEPVVPQGFIEYTEAE